MFFFLLACSENSCPEQWQAWHPDRDGDGFGDAITQVMACEAPLLMVADGSDCDDRNSQVNPNALEMCDGLDNNCDGVLDDKDTSALGQYAWHPDADNDGFGDANVSVMACEAPPDLLADASDCADDDANIHPGVTEMCDGIDNDCDGLLDDEDTYILGQSLWYADVDGDGFGDEANSALACWGTEGWVANDRDCVDTDPRIHPSAQEQNDGIDNDCDGAIDVYMGRVLIMGDDNARAFCQHYNTIYGDLIIQYWHGVDLSMLSCLQFVAGDVRIENNDSLESLAGLENLIHVSDNLSINNNDALIHLQGLSGLTTIGQTISIENNKVLSSLSGLENITTLYGALTINNNASLGDLDGLEGLDSTWGIIINNNAILRNISALSSLSFVSNDFRISHNPMLPLAHATAVAHSIPLVDNIIIIH